MPLPFGRIIAQVVVPLIATIARAIPSAYSQALQNARRNGVDATTTATNLINRKISKSEALQILNIAEGEITAKAVEKQFEKYFAANAVEKGGSFYIQSKIYRAKELLDEYLKEERAKEQKK